MTIREPRLQNQTIIDFTALHITSEWQFLSFVCKKRLVNHFRIRYVLEIRGRRCRSVSSSTKKYSTIQKYILDTNCTGTMNWTINLMLTKTFCRITSTFGFAERRIICNTIFLGMLSNYNNPCIVLQLRQTPNRWIAMALTFFLCLWRTGNDLQRYFSLLGPNRKK